jgi:hypothetical protein
MHQRKTGRGPCLSADEIVSLVLEKLSPEREIAIAAHLAECQECRSRTERVREGFRLLDRWTAKRYGQAIRVFFQDWVVSTAAAAEAREPVEVETEGGRYRLGLYPQQDGTKWLLIVQPLFDCPEGAEIIVRDNERVWLRAPVVFGCASAVLSERPDLGQLVVSCRTEPLYL